MKNDHSLITKISVSHNSKFQGDSKTSIEIRNVITTSELKALLQLILSLQKFMFFLPGPSSKTYKTTEKTHLRCYF